MTVGRAASAHYATDETWIFLSRDLQGVPRRYLLDFTADGIAANPDRLLPNLLGMGSWLAVVGLTVLLALWRWRRPAGMDGPAAAFLMLGAWLGCFHFMYYDTLLAALPVCLLFAAPLRWWLRNPVPTTLLVLLIALPHAADGIDYLRTAGRPTYHLPPFDTFCLARPLGVVRLALALGRYRRSVGRTVTSGRKMRRRRTYHPSSQKMVRQRRHWPS